MTNILVSIGKNIGKIHDELENDFINIKKGKCCRTTYDNFNISTINNSEQDESIAVGENRGWIVGTLIYKKRIASAAFLDFMIDYNEGIDINKILDFTDGHFVIVIYNRKKILLITDHVGLINIYYYRQRNEFIFATSSIVLSRNFPVTINYKSVGQFLRTGSVYNERTIYNEINLLSPAGIYSYEVEDDVKI